MNANCREIFHNYLLKVENDTRTTLQMINDDIDRNGATFNQELKDSLLHLTNARLSLAYDEFSLSSTMKTQLSVEDSEKTRDDIERSPEKAIESSVQSNDENESDIQKGISSSWYETTKLKTATNKLVQTDNIDAGSAVATHFQTFGQQQQQKQHQPLGSVIFGQPFTFGTQPPTSSSNSLFRPSPTFTGFRAPKTNVFGNNVITVFGQPTKSTTNTGIEKFETMSPVTIFSTPKTTTVTGTSIAKFQPHIGTDSIAKHGESKFIATKQHCITAMKEYEGKALDELRLEDYSANRKGPQADSNQGGDTFGSTHEITSIFCASPAKQP